MDGLFVGVPVVLGNAGMERVIEISLTDEEKVIACQLAKVAGADFVKTSTGFGPGGATVEDVALMRRVVGPTMGVKAAGGIRAWRVPTTSISPASPWATHPFLIGCGPRSTYPASIPRGCTLR